MMRRAPEILIPADERGGAEMLALGQRLADALLGDALDVVLDPLAGPGPTDQSALAASSE